jgi:peptide deformylase
MAPQVLKHPDERLRIVSDPFEVGRKLRNAKALNKVREMIDIMYAEGGIGLAAPQINWHVRILVMRLPMFDDALVLFNPAIVNYSVEQKIDVEGCLSVPGKRGKVKRPSEVRVQAHVATSKAIREGKPELMPRLVELNGDPARCVQHEIDHLDGKLYIDKALAIWDVS